jgi:hypothetical protein
VAIYKTKYFGDFEAEDDQDLIEIETTVQEGGEDKEVSIIIHYSGAYLPGESGLLKSAATSKPAYLFCSSLGSDCSSGIFWK